MEIKGYITNLGKYNEGALIGKYITFPIDEDDLNDVLREIGCCYYDEEGEYINTGYEEFFFTDWECDFNHNFGEYENIEHMNELSENLSAWEDDKEKFKAACDWWGFNYVVENSPDDYYLHEDIRDNYDLGYYFATECCCVDFGENEILERYFDFESYGRDINLESDGGFTNYGWVEYVG